MRGGRWKRTSIVSLVPGLAADVLSERKMWKPFWATAWCSWQDVTRQISGLIKYLHFGKLAKESEWILLFHAIHGEM